MKSKSDCYLDYIKKMHNIQKEVLKYTTIASCKGDELSKEQWEKWTDLSQKLNDALPSAIMYVISGTLRCIIRGDYNKGSGKQLCMHHKAVEKICEIDPTFFDGVNINIGEPNDGTE